MNPVRSIGIVGGGSAGWMAAALLSRLLPAVPVQLIESDEIGTVGVGEATIPPIRALNRQLGLNEAEFVAATAGSFKLGIRFRNWGWAGNAYFHPFGSYGQEFDAVPLHQWWLKARHDGAAVPPLDDLTMAWALAAQARFAPASPDVARLEGTHDHAYHFDAGLYARLLRGRAEAQGVVRHEGRITHASRDGETGHVTAVHLADGRQITADLWIDCSGFRALLIGETLGVPFDDWSHLLPCDRALAVPTARGGAFTPYTSSTAHAAGWQWRIPLQHRTGNGHVFCSGAMGEDEAASILLANLDAPALAEPRLLRFTTGRRRRAWEGNVVALGLAAGFMEPLESTSIHLVQSGLQRLVALFPDAAMPALARDEYNAMTATEWERIRDFLVLHYHLNRRPEPLWRQVAAMPIPDSLAHRIAHFRQTGRLVSPGPELFFNPSWLAVHVGQGNIPLGHDPVADARPRIDAPRHFAELARRLAQAAAGAPDHAAFVARHCAMAQAA